MRRASSPGMALGRGIPFVLVVSLVLMFVAASSSYALEECKSVDLSGMQVYKVDLAEHKCSSWTETKSDGYYKIGCNFEAGTVRAYGINAVEVPSGAGTMRIKATIRTTDSRVHYDDYADLTIFTMDKGPELSLTCGKSTTDWPNECVIKDMTSGSLGHCGLPKYTGSRACDFTIDVSGRNTIYVTFSMHDPWDLAFGALKNTFENVQICCEETATPTPTPTPVQVKQDGQSCSSNSECGSENCGSGICCAYGEACCGYGSDCPSGYECGSSHYCVEKAATPTPTPAPTRTPTPTRTATPGPAQIVRTPTPTPIPVPTMGLVISVNPAKDAEALELKRLIENDIYPAIAGIFDKNSRLAFTGPRDYDPEIKLQLVFDTPTAMWDEKTNTLYVPASKVYEDMGAYGPKIMQLNAIAHELTHYHLNGFALKNGGDFGRVPLWFREGLAEYGAHAFYKNYITDPPASFSAYLGNAAIPPTTSVSEAREIRFRDYLSDGSIHYKETVESDALDKVSWLDEAGMDTSLTEYAHVYYGAAFSFVNYLLGKSTFRSGESMMDVLKYMFMMGSKGKFRFYAHAGDEKNPYDEQSIKKGWYEQFINKHEIDNSSLKSRPGLIKTITDGVGSIFKGIWSSIFGR